MNEGVYPNPIPTSATLQQITDFLQDTLVLQKPPSQQLYYNPSQQSEENIEGNEVNDGLWIALLRFTRRVVSLYFYVWMRLCL